MSITVTINDIGSDGMSIAFSTGDTWDINNGYLTIYDVDRSQLATFSPGQWTRITNDSLINPDQVSKTKTLKLNE